MNISDYFIEDNNSVFFEEAQASRFAKSVAGDFNPIHDPGSKRFCVPGDLLFSVVLGRYGVSEKTCLEFSGMLDGKTRMHLPLEASDVMSIVDDRDKELMNVQRSGERITDAHFISMLCEEYVKFSGQTFPDILVPLMRSANAMINPARPLVIYKDMAIHFNRKAFTLFDSESSQAKSVQAGNAVEPIFDGQDRPTVNLRLKSGDHQIAVDGRKGSVKLAFTIECANTEIGSGVKNMLLSGLREYEDDAMMEIVAQYNQWRTDYSPN